MATVTLTNLTSPQIPVWIQDIYANVPVGSPGVLTFTRNADEIPKLQTIMTAKDQGKISVAISYNSDELASGLTIAPGSINAAGMTPVVADDSAAPMIVIRKFFAAGAGGAADDVTVYAAGFVPYKMRIVDAVGFVSTAVATKLLQVRSALTGGGTLFAEVSGATTGHQDQTATVTATGVVLPTDALIVHRTDSGIAGEMLIRARLEQ